MRIIDLHDVPADVTEYKYVGRRMAGSHPLNGSPLANPFKLMRGKSPDGIAKIIQQYREWLYAKLRWGDAEVLKALRTITDDSVLACWCCDLSGPDVLAGPYQCHAQVIFAAARWLRSGVPPVVELLPACESRASLFEEVR